MKTFEKLIFIKTFLLEHGDGNSVDSRTETVTFTLLLLKIEVYTKL